jgi:hypothetical protein
MNTSSLELWQQNELQASSNNSSNINICYTSTLLGMYISNIQ